MVNAVYVTEGKVQARQRMLLILTPYNFVYLVVVVDHASNSIKNGWLMQCRPLV